MNDLENLKEKLEELQKSVGYVFKDINNLILALTHSSYANECRKRRLHSNERLEFLGDAILNTVISESLYNDGHELSEGEMTKIRASIVCEPSLTKCANNIGLGKYLLLGKGEELTGGRGRISILSDAFEALIGAIYIDGGMESAKDFIMRQMGDLIANSIKGDMIHDYKTQLQEIMQKNPENKISYELIEEKGPDHSKVFVTQVKVGDKVMGTGQGKSKKESEQNAARAALEKAGEQ